jgi:broad specificity phosphatase PhoE
MSTLYLIRHGDTPKHSHLGFTLDELTPCGREVIVSRAQSLKQAGIAVVIAAPSIRTLQSAECMATEFGVNVTVDTRLREISRGIFDQRPYAEFEAQWAQHGFDYDYVPNGGESVNQGRTRIVEAMRDIRAKLPSKSIVCVTHAGIIANLLMMLYRLPFKVARPECGDVCALRYERGLLLAVDPCFAEPILGASAEPDQVFADFPQ